MEMCKIKLNQTCNIFHYLHIYYHDIKMAVILHLVVLVYFQTFFFFIYIYFRNTKMSQCLTSFYNTSNYMCIKNPFLPNQGYVS